MGGKVKSKTKDGPLSPQPFAATKMVAPSGAMSDSESSSSDSSDAEELARCREAATPAWGLEQRPREAERPAAGRGAVRGPGLKRMLGGVRTTAS